MTSNIKILIFIYFFILNFFEKILLIENYSGDNIQILYLMFIEK